MFRYIGIRLSTEKKSNWHDRESLLHKYGILYSLSFSIQYYATRIRNVIKWAISIIMWHSRTRRNAHFFSSISISGQKLYQTCV